MCLLEGNPFVWRGTSLSPQPGEQQGCAWRSSGSELWESHWECEIFALSPAPGRALAVETPQEQILRELCFLQCFPESYKSIRIICRSFILFPEIFPAPLGAVAVPRIPPGSWDGMGARGAQGSALNPSSALSQCHRLTFF